MQFCATPDRLGQRHDHCHAVAQSERRGAPPQHDTLQGRHFELLYCLNLRVVAGAFVLLNGVQFGLEAVYPGWWQA